jgi:ribonuclease J
MLTGGSEMEVVPVGGYEEVGRNMSLVRDGDNSIIIDMGIRLDRVLIHEDTDISKLSQEELVRRGIIPDDTIIKEKVRAIILSHGHLDHLGAVTLLASKYKAPVIGTPYTLELVKRELRHSRGKKRIELHVLEEGKSLHVADGMEVELVKVTHSIPQSSFVVVHTKNGVLVYANDFKLDDHPVIGDKPDYRRLKKLGKEGVKGLIVETTRINNEGRTPSESIAKRLIEDSLMKTDPKRGLVVTTFSSHISRIKSITEMASAIDRVPVLLGRSMEKYISIAEELRILDLPDNAHLYGDRKSIKKILGRVVNDGKDKYLLVVTGHQGEPDALLSRMAGKKLPYRITKGDQVIFSADVIPNPINVANRYAMETKLKMQGARLFKGNHVSGHAAKEDHRDLIKLLQPELIVPCHGDLRMLASYAELAEDEGYALNRDLFLVRNAQLVRF